MINTRGWTGLADFSKALYKDTYFLPNEDYDAWVTRVARAYQNDVDHGSRISMYIRNFWFHPSTPISSNAGTDRGLPISCFTRSVPDTKEGIFSTYNEGFHLGAYGGGIGTDWSPVRSVNEPVGAYGGTSSGIIPFQGITDRATLAISQGGLRRASEASYLHISHPEIEEFIDLRKPTGDQNRRAPNLHHGVAIPDSFMDAVINDLQWDLVSPKSGDIIKTVSAKSLWKRLLEVRATLKGEPYLLFLDTVNDLAPAEYKADNITVTTSNLCTEITLRTDEKNTGVCCLASVNLEYYDEWKDDPQFIADCTDFLDNVLQDFIDRTENLPGFEKARHSAMDERSIGLGVMGFHSYLQAKMIPWETPMAKGINTQIFNHIKQEADYHNKYSDSCPMSDRSPDTLGFKRNIHVTAIAPTMSISSLCNVTSSGVEPWVANTFTKKVKQGSFAVTNKHLDKVITEASYKYGSTAVEYNRDQWVRDQWASIKKNNGSVQHLDWMDDWTKDVFKTAFEIDQKWLIEFAGDRSPLIDQGQSINLFIPGDSHVQTISDLHILAWKKKVKSLYYLRSSAVNRATTDSTDRKEIQTTVSLDELTSDSCVGCA